MVKIRRLSRIASLGNTTNVSCGEKSANYFLERATMLIYGGVLMTLAMYKAAIMWKETAGLKGLGLVKVLIRDQAFYFFA